MTNMLWLNRWLNANQVQALVQFHEDLEAEDEARLTGLHAILGERAMDVLVASAMVDGWDKLEKAAQLPSRSAQVVLPITCDFLISIYSGRDRHIY